MSDPVTNMQIEDVLSSIRKLVSEEVRAQTHPRRAPGAQQGRPEMLILTPAHRVPEDGATTPEDAPDSPEADAAGAGTDFDMDAFSRELLRDALPEAEFDDADIAADEEDDDELPVETPLFRHDRSAGRGWTPAGFEDEGANAGAPLDISAYAAPAEDAHDDLIAAEDDEGPASPIPSFLRSRGVSSLNEPLRTAAPETAEDALSWEDHETPSMPAGALGAAAGEIEGDLWAEPGEPEESGQPAMIDEETLRDMVSEIVRQELQGALGERITRNVRKLVRREIQRALTAHDLL